MLVIPSKCLLANFSSIRSSRLMLAELTLEEECKEAHHSMFWNINVDELLQNLQRYGWYAKDLAIMISGIDLHTLLPDHISIKPKSLQQSGVFCSLSVNLHKTKVSFFLPDDRNLNLNGFQLSMSNRVNYLGREFPIASVRQSVSSPFTRTFSYDESKKICTPLNSFYFF